MTLPTGVSTFLLDCLDVDSTVDYNTHASESLTSSPSPETFRDDDSERSNFCFGDSGKYKNSTLLDSSKAVTIDKMPQISDLSVILEPVLEDFRGGHIRRKKPSDCSHRSSALSVSTTVAGKKVCKITAARERTPDLKTVTHSSSSLGPERKPAKQTAKPKGLTCKKKDTNSNALEGGTASRSQCDAPGSASAGSVELTARVLPSKRRDAVVPLCGRQETCSIVRTSPCQRPPRLHQIPADTKPFCLPKRVPEDIITSTQNWIYCKHR
ncbi:hypothetical protein N326_10676 [Eurypyga helias]|uniref:Meiosis-specific kinetochore protein n=1 Tax=Eurypyga helias TaxID=54383 RepID=A0A093IY64_EURHL|nr:hypothetical protein N326_10676 [Eurypyga helias]